MMPFKTLHEKPLPTLQNVKYLAPNDTLGSAIVGTKLKSSPGLRVFCLVWILPQGAHEASKATTSAALAPISACSCTRSSSQGRPV